MEVIDSYTIEHKQNTENLNRDKRDSCNNDIDNNRTLHVSEVWISGALTGTLPFGYAFNNFPNGFAWLSAGVGVTPLTQEYSSLYHIRALLYRM